jgi:hypothetical protein
VQLREQEVYAALRSGELRSWIARDESGNLVLAERCGWGCRKFYSLHGHDLAIPLSGYQGDPNVTFGWGRAFEITETLSDMLSGGDSPLPVPSNVWMDPVFSAVDAENLWPRVADGFNSKEDRFVQWMKAQKNQFGRYPPRSRAEEWAQQAGIQRDLVRKWVGTHSLSNGRGAPRKNLATN